MVHTPSHGFTEVYDSIGDEMDCANPPTLVKSDPVTHKVWDTPYPVSASWKSSLRIKTLVEGVSVLQS